MYANESRRAAGASKSYCHNPSCRILDLWLASLAQSVNLMLNFGIKSGDPSAERPSDDRDRTMMFRFRGKFDVQLGAGFKS